VGPVIAALASLAFDLALAAIRENPDHEGIRRTEKGTSLINGSPACQNQ
jgi:hypothetical protein